MRRSDTFAETLNAQYTQASRFPLLSRQEEIDLARRYRATGDIRLMHRLMNSNLKFVLKVAHEYAGYGLSFQDLAQEGNLGLMMAIRRFDPDKGVRLLSYAVWWIRAYIQAFIIKEWSLVKVGTTQGQRRLFFKMKSERSEAARTMPNDDSASITTHVAKRLHVAEEEVRSMEQRLAGRDLSLDATVAGRPDLAFVDSLKTASPNQESQLAAAEDAALVRKVVDDLMASLDERERYIVKNRIMSSDAPETLRVIGGRFRVSRERVRQIERRVQSKLRCALEHSGLQEATV